jgi:NAD(P)-dependent dehydrogenase (short-subunit alcohol dehydrogenase family)
MTTRAHWSDFAGRTAIVTGGGKGLGRAYAHWLARHGCAVVVNNRASGSASPASTVTDEIIAAGGRAVAHDGAVEDAASAEAMVALALARFGGTDILVCNAGIQRWTHFSDMTIADMRDLIDVNLWGTLLPLQAAWKAMIAQGYGRIVLTGSGAGLWGQQRSVHYSATKAAMTGIARALTLDVPDGADIRINVIAPAAYTPMSSDSIDAQWAGFMAPDRVAPVVGWLASAACDVSGAVYHSGAGRVRRVRVTESLRHELGGDMDATMHGLSGPPEPASSFGAGAELMPELFAPADSE